MRHPLPLRVPVIGLAAVLTLAVLAPADHAHADPVPLDDIDLVGTGRTWDLEGTDGTFGVGDGSISVTRLGSDAFDGGLQLGAGGTPFAPRGTGEKVGNTVTVGPARLLALDVTRVETASGPYLRSLVKLRNPTSSRFSEFYTWTSDLGSDGDESTQASPAGRTTELTPRDRWVVTSESGKNGDDDDPTLAFVLSGKRASEPVAAVTSRPGSGTPEVEYHLDIPPRSTRYLLFFTEMHPNPATAVASMAKYDDADLSAALLAGLSRTVRRKIVNWDL